MAAAKVYLEYFPFAVLKLLGGTLMVFGAILLGLGIGDVAHTVKYYGRNSDCETNYPESVLAETDFESPCGNGVLDYAFVSAPIWSGILIALLGVIGTRFDIENDPYDTENWRERFMYGGLLAFAVLLPVTFGVAIAEFVMGHKVFYAITQPGAVHGMLDGVKFAVPLVVIVIAVFGFMVAAYATYLAFTNPIDCEAEMLEETDDASDITYRKSDDLEKPYFVGPSESRYGYDTYGGRPAISGRGYGGRPTLPALGYY